MTDPIDFTLNTPEEQRIVTVVPINITLTSGILYSTGQYDINEGTVGLGTITFDAGNEWTYEGFGDISISEIERVAEHIRRLDNRQLVTDDKEVVPQSTEVDTESTTLNFIAQNSGNPVDVHVNLTYPVYDVAIAGKPAGQLQQDHHSNWFLASGQIDASLVQEIGTRISSEVAGRPS